MKENGIYNRLNIKEASIWATKYLGKTVSPANISYLIQYGRVKKIVENGSTWIDLCDLEYYYKRYKNIRELNFKEKLGEDLNWALSFEQYKESETTKHVHRLHPYKGKFIPQLVEYFLDTHTDKFKQKVYFHKGDIILDPFSGSGTTLVQSNELGINAIGIDISSFNALIGNCKVGNYDFKDLQNNINIITTELECFVEKSKIMKFDKELLQELNIFNNKYFPTPIYKYKLRQGAIDENNYGKEKEKIFEPIYNKLINKYSIKISQDNNKTFLDKWYLNNIRNEIEFIFERIKKINNIDTQNIMCLILSRVIRSCRATTHADLATLIQPITKPYYCHKHGKICKPIFSLVKWWKTYSKDTILRLKSFDSLRTKTFQLCLTGDSRNINIFSEIEKHDIKFGKLLKNQKIKGIFSSPPYVGLIDYHEQHAYAYDLFGFKRNDNLEIGPLYKGQDKIAQKNYVQGISDVLNNCKKYLADNYDIFLVANDKYNLYPTIAEKAGMKIVNSFKRPVLNRTEKNKCAYSETIFHLKDKIYVK